MRRITVAVLIVILFALSFLGLSLALNSSDASVANAAPAQAVKILGSNISGRVNLATQFAALGGQISGYATFSNGTLTLESVVILSVESAAPVIWAENGDLVVSLQGTNRLGNQCATSQVILVSNGSLTVNGNGKLEIDNPAARPIQIQNGDANFNAGTVTVRHSFAAVYINENRAVRFASGVHAVFSGSGRAFADLNESPFTNVNVPAECGVRVGASEGNSYPAQSYGGERYLMVYTRPRLNSANSTFDKYNPASVVVTIESHQFISFTGIQDLQPGTHYSISGGNTITLFPNNFLDRPVGQRSLTFNFTLAASVVFVVNIVDTAPSATVTLTPTQDMLDALNPKIIEVQIRPLGKFKDVTGNNITAQDYQYDIMTGTFMFRPEFVSALPNGNYPFVFTFNDDAPSQTFTLIVENSMVDPIVNPPTGNDSAISPTQGTFDKYTSKPEHRDLVITLYLNGNSLILIRNGLSVIQPRYYTRSNNLVTIYMNYLNTLQAGPDRYYPLTFVFSDGEDQVFNLRVIDTNPLPNGRSPFYDNPVPVDPVDAGGGNEGNITAPIGDGNGDVAALVILSIFASVGAASCVVWIILRKKRIV